MQEKPVRPYHHGDLRRVVIETAQDMLREDKGWQFTLREVARRAGVSHAAPYKHFPDKSVLLAELASIGFEDLRAQISDAVTPPPRSARAEFACACKAYIRFGMANPSLYRLMFSGEVDKADHERLREASSNAFAVLVDLLERGQGNGAFKKQPVRAQAAASWSLIHGFTMLAIDGQLVPDKAGGKSVDAVLTALLEGLEC